jgi:hypothetical protein
VDGKVCTFQSKKERDVKLKQAKADSVAQLAELAKCLALLDEDVNLWRLSKSELLVRRCHQPPWLVRRKPSPVLLI